MPNTETRRNGHSKHDRLLADPEVRRWHADLARGSKCTAKGYLKKLGIFLEQNHQTPHGYLALGKRDRENLLIDHITALEERGLAPTGIKSTKFAVQSWLAHNDCHMTRPIKIRGLNSRPSLKDEYIPASHELQATYNAGTPKSRLANSLLANAGVRPEVMGNLDGSDGLRYEDLPETHFEGDRLVTDRIPTLVHVREELSKTKQAYDTFLGPQGCEFLVAETQARIQAGEKLGPRSAILSPLKGDRDFMTSASVSQLIRLPMQRAGLRLRPYVWRCYFDNRIQMVDPSKLHPNFQVYMMGHTGNLEVHYAMRNKKKLPPDMVEKMRAGYQAALRFLETTAPISLEDPAVDVVRLVLQAAGLPQDDVAAMDLANMSRDELLALMRQHLKPQAPVLVQRIVPSHELASLLAQGWLYRASLPDGQVVVEGPANPTGTNPVAAAPA